MEKIRENLLNNLKQLGVEQIDNLDFKDIIDIIAYKSNGRLSVNINFETCFGCTVYFGDCSNISGNLSVECASSNKTEVAMMLLEWCIENGYVKV